MAKPATLELTNLGRSSKGQVSSWLRDPYVGHTEHEREAFLALPDDLLPIRFAWGEVHRLVELFKRLVQTREERRITADVFRREVLEDVDRLMSLCKLMTSRTALESEHPGLHKGLQVIGAELSNSRIGWTGLARLGERVLEGAAGEHDYVKALGQLLSSAIELKWLLGRRKVDVDARSRPKFCPMCWRFVVFDTKYCPVHTPSKGNTMGQTEKHDLKSLVKHGDCYSYARRLQPRFLSNLKKIHAADRREKRKASWWSAIGDQQVRRWLASFRPNVHEVFGINLEQMDRIPGNQSRSEAEQRRKFHAFLMNDPEAHFEAIQRAEAWLAAASERRSNWGGTRKNAGRPIEARRK